MTLFTADHVAAAIVAAAREMGADPIAAVSGAKDRGIGRQFPNLRTRAYAAIVLRDVFPTILTAAIGRAVGHPNHPEIWAAQLFSERKIGLRWWDEEIYRRVRRAVQALAKEPPAEPMEAVSEPGPAPAVELPPFVLPRPAASERQRKAAQMLEEAVRNTTAMSRHSQ